MVLGPRGLERCLRTAGGSWKLSVGHVTLEDVQLTGADFDRIPRTNLRVPVVDFAQMWLAAEQYADTHPQDWYGAGVVMTCRWLARATVRHAVGPAHVARAPVTERSKLAYEELIEAECFAAEKLDLQRPVPAWLADRPGWLAGVLATLNWAWRRAGGPPLIIAATAAG